MILTRQLKLTNFVTVCLNDQQETQLIHLHRCNFKLLLKENAFQNLIVDFFEFFLQIWHYVDHM